MIKVNNLFHDKYIEVYSYGKYKDSDGVTRKGYSKKISDLKCNVQPITSQRAREVYGYSVDCTKRVFLDSLDDINIVESDIILYKGKTYNIQQIIEWNTYCVLLILEKVVDING